MRKLYEIFKLSWIQKRIVAAATRQLYEEIRYTARKDPSLNSLQFDIDVLSYCLSHFYWRIYPHKRQFLILLDLMICTYFTIWQYGLSIFQVGDTKLERFLPKNQHTQRKWLNLENLCSGELSNIGHHFIK